MLSSKAGWPTSLDVGERFLLPNRAPTFNKVGYPRLRRVKPCYPGIMMLNVRTCRRVGLRPRFEGLI